jgi:ABC-type Zn uptake system ZnuABC Zn-binding protein ZnuA
VGKAIGLKSVAAAGRWQLVPCRRRGVIFSLAGDHVAWKGYGTRAMRLCGALIECMGLLWGLWASPALAQRQIAIASIFPVADLAQRIGGERWEVLTLIPAGASAHTYEPTPEQVRQLSQARVFFRIGLGLEFWLEKLVQAAKNPALSIIDLSEGMETLPTPSAELPPQSPEHSHPGHTSRSPPPAKESSRQVHTPEAPDAHYWLDLVRMQQVVRHMAQVFGTLDPEQAPAYHERAERVRLDLEDLHQEILQHTQGLPHRRFIAMHSAWTYFAPRYHLEQVAVIEPFPGREPSPRYLAELAKLMQKAGVKAVVIEPQLSITAAQALARETGAKVGMLDPTGGQGVPGRDSYMALMRYNVAELLKLLQ